MTEMHAEAVHAVKVAGVWSTSLDYHISLEPLGRRVRGYRGRRVELPAPHRRVPAHRIPDVLLQRGGGRNPRRGCRRGEAAHAVVPGLSAAAPVQPRGEGMHSERFVPRVRMR